MSQLPIVTAEITFLTYAEGGRVQLPYFVPPSSYMPHLVVQNPDIRQATVSGKQIIDDYLGIRFIEGPEDYIAGQAGQFRLQLMYWPEVNYDALQVGSTFTVREGARVIGYGTVMERKNLPIGHTA